MRKIVFFLLMVSFFVLPGAGCAVRYGALSVEMAPPVMVTSPPPPVYYYYEHYYYVPPHRHHHRHRHHH